MQVDCFHALRKSDPPFVSSGIFIKQGLASFVCANHLCLFLTSSFITYLLLATVWLCINGGKSVPPIGN